MCKKPKPCPFCGAAPHIFGHPHSFKVICLNTNCPVFVETEWVESKKKAVRIWNHRVNKGDD